MRYRAKLCFTVQYPCGGAAIFSPQRGTTMDLTGKYHKDGLQDIATYRTFIICVYSLKI